CPTCFRYSICCNCNCTTWTTPLFITLLITNIYIYIYIYIFFLYDKNSFEDCSFTHFACAAICLSMLIFTKSILLPRKR
ncbi:hypothetical protein ACMBCM_07835, partial [Spiroplasma sp. K1]